MSSRSKQKASKNSGPVDRRPRAITDSRFASIQTDPRYRLPSRKHQRVQLDERFSRMLDDEDFSRKAKVDRYGRKIPEGAGKKELKRLYSVGDEQQLEPDADESGDDEDGVQEELARIDRKYDPAREGGFSESSSDEDSDDSSDEEDEEVDDENEDELTAANTEANTLSGRPGKEEMSIGEITSRLALVNLDWDHIRSADLFAVASSFCPAGGKVQQVSIYPSEFGKERMEREELEGPPRELFVDSKANGSPSNDNSEDEDEDSDDAEERIKRELLASQTDDTAELDSHALRAYQLSRLRYYYAVLEADSSTTAHALYNDMDGREYLSTSNFFDLRFIPDDVSFATDKPRDTCVAVPGGYKPNDFVTEALTHSKVRLTWDEEDRSRKEAQKRAFSSRDADTDDLAAYVGSDSDASDFEGFNEEDDDPAANGIRKSKAEAERARLRAALGLSSTNQSASKSKPSGNMQITFTAGIHDPSSARATKSTVFENTPEDVRIESTREAYIRKERERKARRKARAKAARQGGDDDGGAGEEVPRPGDDSVSASLSEADDTDDKDPFNDPFFTDPTSTTTTKQSRKPAKQKPAKNNEAQKQAEAELSLLLADENETIPHFDMAEIKKSEKKKNKKNKRGKSNGKDDDDNMKGDGFEMNVSDPRFAGVFERHEYAIDPNNPRFSGTRGMKQLLEEGRRKRKTGGAAAAEEEDLRDTGAGVGKKLADGAKSTGDDGEIERLLARVKKQRR